MSILPPQVHAELAELLQALQSSDNNVRSQAEDHLTTNWTNAKPEMLLMGLVEQIHGSNDTTVSRPCPISSIRQDVVEKQ
jgi:importin-5